MQVNSDGSTKVLRIPLSTVKVRNYIDSFEAFMFYIYNKLM